MKNPIQKKYIMPAEWAVHEGTWLVWPHNQETWPGKFEKIPSVWIEMVRALHSNEKVNILVNDLNSKNKVKKILEDANAWSKNVILHVIPTNDSWIRDFGPIFVKDQNGNSIITDWIFNVWGGRWEKERPLDDIVPTKIAKEFGYPLVEPGIVLEGGSIDVNGKGTLLTTESCLLSPTRNPHLNRRQIEKYLSDYLGITTVIWLKEGIAGDDTSGHIDDLARFVNENTVVCMIEEDQNSENYKPLMENFKRLQKSKDQDGKALKVIPLPMPAPVPGPTGEGYMDNCVPASYANFYIANNVVLLPTYRSPYDSKVAKILAEFFPSRKIIGIDSYDLVWGLGAIHCSTQQQPA